MPKTIAATHLSHAAAPEVAAWVASAPLGTTGTSAELLPAFLASSPTTITCYGVAWSAGSLGASLARLRDLHVAGRKLTRAINRKGVSIWSVVAVS